MTLRDLLERLGVPADKYRNEPTWQRYEDELFPTLGVTRLEERRLLNAAPVAVAPAMPTKDIAAEAHTSPDAGKHDQAGSDVRNLAVTMYGGPAHGDLTTEMHQLSGGGGGHGGDSSAGDPTESGKLGASPNVSAAVTTNPATAAADQVAVPLTLTANQPPVNVVPGAANDQRRHDAFDQRHFCLGYGCRFVADHDPVHGQSRDAFGRYHGRRGAAQWRDLDARRDGHHR